MNVAELVERLNTEAVTNQRPLSPVFQTLVEQLCWELPGDPGLLAAELFHLNREAHNALIAYAWVCAAEAVRQNSTDRILTGLAALVVIENGDIDIRDTVRSLASLFHSASLLAMNTVDLFGSYARLSRSSILAARFREFSLPPGSSSIALRHFGLRVSGKGKSFGYRDDESLARALRRYVTAPNLSLRQRFWFIVMVLLQEKEKWQFWRR